MVDLFSHLSMLDQQVFEVSHMSPRVRAHSHRSAGILPRPHLENVALDCFQVFPSAHNRSCSFPEFLTHLFRSCPDRIRIISARVADGEEHRRYEENSRF